MPRLFRAAPAREVSVVTVMLNSQKGLADEFIVYNNGMIADFPIYIVNPTKWVRSLMRPTTED